MDIAWKWEGKYKNSKAFEKVHSAGFEPIANLNSKCANQNDGIFV
jgi:hypothetical protein